MDIQQVSDTLEIQNLGYRFADAANRRDYPAFKALWADAGVWHIGAPINLHFDGREAIGQAIETLLGRWEFFVQLPHAPVITLAGDTATARWTVMEQARTLDRKTGNVNLSFYDDELVRDGGQWRFLKRAYATRYADETPLAGRAW